MTTTDPEDARPLVMRVFSILASAKGDYTATPTGPLPGPDRPHELGEFLGEGFYYTADTAAKLAAHLDQRGADQLMRGVTTEWFQAARGAVGNEPQAALAFLARLVHAAIHGVAASGKDLDDAHRLSVQLQECLAACAGTSGVVDGIMQFLAEQRGPDTK